MASKAPSVEDQGTVIVVFIPSALSVQVLKRR